MILRSGLLSRNEVLFLFNISGLIYLTFRLTGHDYSKFNAGFRDIGPDKIARPIPYYKAFKIVKNCISRFVDFKLWC